MNNLFILFTVVVHRGMMKRVKHLEVMTNQLDDQRQEIDNHLDVHHRINHHVAHPIQIQVLVVCP